MVSSDGNSSLEAEELHRELNVGLSERVEIVKRRILRDAEQIPHSQADIGTGQKSLLNSVI